MVQVAAVTGEGLVELSEALLLEADQLDLRVHRRLNDAEGVVLEAKVDKGHGALVTVLLRQGTLSVGESGKRPSPLDSPPRPPPPWRQGMRPDFTRECVRSPQTSGSSSC